MSGAQSRLTKLNESKKKRCEEFGSWNSWALTSNTAGPGDAHETYFFNTNSTSLIFMRALQLFDV